MGRSISLASSRQMGASQAATVASTKPTVAILVLVVMASGTLHLRQQDKPLNQLQIGTYNQYTPDATAGKELGEDQAGFDGLAKANVIGQQQGNTRHKDGLENGVESVIFHLYGALPGRDQPEFLFVLLPLRSQVINGTPPVRSQEGVEQRRVIRGLIRFIDTRNSQAGHYTRSTFQLPDQIIAVRVRPYWDECARQQIAPRLGDCAR